MCRSTFSIRSRSGNRDLNTHDARLTKSTVSSKAFTWQAHFWDNAVVGTYGVREDIAKSWQYSLNPTSASSLPANNNRLNLSPTNYKLNADPDNRLQVTSHAWTVVAHLNQFAKVLDRLPLQVTPCSIITRPTSNRQLSALTSMAMPWLRRLA